MPNLFLRFFVDFLKKIVISVIVTGFICIGWVYGSQITHIVCTLYTKLRNTISIIDNSILHGCRHFYYKSTSVCVCLYVLVWVQWFICSGWIENIHSHKQLGIWMEGISTKLKKIQFFSPNISALDTNMCIRMLSKNYHCRDGWTYEKEQVARTPFATPAAPCLAAHYKNRINVDVCMHS